VLWLGVASCASTRSEAGAVDPAIVRIAEAKLDPICGRPLNSYDRYYALVRVEGRDLIAGRFVTRSLVSLRRARSLPIVGADRAFTTTEQNLPTCRRDRQSCNIVRLRIDSRTGNLIPGPDEFGLVIVCMSDH